MAYAWLIIEPAALLHMAIMAISVTVKVLYDSRAIDFYTSVVIKPTIWLAYTIACVIYHGPGAIVMACKASIHLVCDITAFHAIPI